MAATALLAVPAVRAADGLDQPVQQTQRLSAWLEQHADAVSAGYPLGLMWQVDSERDAQERERSELLGRLGSMRDAPGYRPGDVDRLMDRIRSMPVTGRVRTAAAEGRWLEADPRRDPVLQPGDRIVLPARPTSVSVLHGDGRLCPVRHEQAATAAHYVARCRLDGHGAGRAPDWAWVVQPDGRIQKAGIAAWNRTAPLQLAPGAWIWAPPGGVDDDAAAVDEALARWLSWQGAAADPPTAQAMLTLRLADADLRADAGDDLRAATHTATGSDWGYVGLLQTPTARMREPGAFALGFQRTLPYTQASVFLQPLPALEVGFRYTDIANRRYGPQAWSGNQSYKDKSIDAKLRLMRESRHLPELAVGVLDMGGTGLFGSEYLVAGKRWGAFDFSLGLGWGYLGQREDAAHPLSFVSDRFRTRPSEQSLTGQGGTVGLSRFFRGPVGVFGGVQYKPSAWPVLLKLELDGNDYQRDPTVISPPQKSPINLGLVYQPSPGIDLSLGIERGNKASIGIAFKVPMADLSTRKVLDPMPVAVSTSRPAQAPDWSRTVADLAGQTGWQPSGLSLAPDRLRADFEGVYSPHARDRIDKALAVLNRDAPASVETLAVRLGAFGDGHLTAEADRTAWARSMSQPPRSNDPVDPVRITSAVQADEPADAAQVQRIGSQSVPLSLRPALDLSQNIGGPNGFVLYQLSAAVRGTLRLPADWWLRGNLRVALLDNYDRYRYDGPSRLPRVRTLLREYQTSSDVMLENLALSKGVRLGGNHYAAVYGGLFEFMYGGVGAEWLYRQPGSRWAVGVDANRVRQRGFHQDLRWRDYRINTGHATLYWDTGWQGIRSSVSVGQYLAGDRGATVVLQKVFANGVTMSAFATKTNVSAAQFGEGSFDKGIAVSLPFDVFMPRSSNLSLGFLWRPLTRDGGAMVGRPVNLIGDTHWLAPDALSYRSAPPPDDEVPPDDRIEPWQRQR